MRGVNKRSAYISPLGSVNLEAGIRRLALVLGLWLSIGAAGRAAGAPAPALITSLHQFWNLSAENRLQPHPFRIECTATYFDPAWKLFWVQQGGEGAFVMLGEHVPAVKAGQRLLVEGTLMPPNVDVSFENATITVLGPSDLAPLSTASGIAEAARFRNMFVSVEGLVDRQELIDPLHLHLTISVEGRAVFAWLLLDPEQTVPQLVDRTVRVNAVYAPKVSPSGKLTSLEIHIASLVNVDVGSPLASDPRFALPVTKIELLGQLPPDRMVRVVGRVRAQEPGHHLRIQDEGGQIDVMTGQAKVCAINEQVEAIGFASANGVDWRLESGIYRPLSSSGGVGVRSDPAATIQLASQVLELSPDEAARRHPVQVTGVVTWSQPGAPFFFVQDASGGVCVQRAGDPSEVQTPGRLVEVNGATGMGAFAPVIVSSRVIKLGDLVLPTARQVSLEQALAGVEEAQWVELRGYLRQTARANGRTEMDLTTAAGNFTAILPPTADVTTLVGSVVRLHGVCTAIANERRKLTGVQLWVPSAEFVQVEEAAPADPFALPARSLASLGQFGSQQSSNRRIRVSGVVLLQVPGQYVYLEEKGESLLVLSRETTRFPEGTQIDAVGFLGRQGGQRVLREAALRSTGRGAPPQPKPLANAAEAEPDLDGHLVTLEGTLLEQSTVRGQRRWTLQTENAFFEAHLDSAAPGAESIEPAGSQLALTGVYVVNFDEEGRGRGFQLRLRSAGDIAVLHRPSWFTRGRIIALAGALAVGILMFTAWVVALRRRVSVQTEQIRTQLQRDAQREKQLEAESRRATKLEALGLLAGGIAHDFNNLLTVVMGNLSLARLDRMISPDSADGLRDATRAVERARDLTQQLLTFAKGGEPIRTAVMLPEIVREVAEFATRGSNVRCRFDLAPGLWPADVDKGQIGQVVQNIVLNAVQAMPGGGQIEIALCNEAVAPATGAVLAPGRYLKVSIVDHGAGIRPEDLPRIFDPYFSTKNTGNGLGLATVYSIVKKHRGHVAVQSVVQRGTTFDIWLPAADQGPGPVAPPAAPPAAPFQARVLFMDDEESIRQVGLAMLKRCGFEAAAVADGAGAVAAYAQAMQAGRPFDLVILDLTVPGGVGGREAMERLRALDPNVKAIVSSGYSNDQVLANYRAHGFRGMVSKPYEVADLKLAIHEVLKVAPA